MSRYKSYIICFTSTSKKQFESLSSKVKKEMAGILESELAYNPLLGKPLQGPLKGLRSQRVGTLRIVYQIIKKELVLMVINIGHRKSVYRIGKVRKK